MNDLVPSLSCTAITSEEEEEEEEKKRRGRRRLEICGGVRIARRLPGSPHCAPQAIDGEYSAL